eukprot:1253566-Pleurochrysis_carterae.AAC.1
MPGSDPNHQITAPRVFPNLQDVEHVRITFLAVDSGDHVRRRQSASSRAITFKQIYTRMKYAR